MQGHAVVTPEYIGYFDETHATSEAEIKRQLAAFMAAFTDPSFIVVGYSLGAHFATWLAATYPDRVRELVLIYPFLSLTAVGVSWFPRLAWFSESITEGILDTGALARRVRCHVRVISGEKDVICPPEQGRALARLFPLSTYEVVQGAGHGQVPFEVLFGQI